MITQRVRVVLGIAHSVFFQLSGTELLIKVRLVFCNQPADLAFDCGIFGADWGFELNTLPRSVIVFRELRVIWR